jgi:DNA-binding NarL/FixJ family response regulator
LRNHSPLGASERRGGAEGRSNAAIAAIAARMFITEKAVSKHTNSIFARLGLPPSDDDNRRVLAVLAYLNG